MSKQVVTIQIGNQSNFIASHFWNTQFAYLSEPEAERELDPSALFREASQSLNTENRFTPRAQIIDACGAFGSLSVQHGHVVKPKPSAEVEADENFVDAWSESRAVFRQDVIPPHPLSMPTNVLAEHVPPGSTPRQEVKYWSDYLSLRLHRRTAHALTGVHHDVTNMEDFSTGIALASTQRLDDLYDDLRFFIEECDSFGGLVIHANADDAYAGLTTQYTQFLRDELGMNAPFLMLAAEAGHRACTVARARVMHIPFEQQREVRQARNEAFCVHACTEQGLQYVPLSSLAGLQLPVRNVNLQNRHHATAALGLAVDVALSPLRSTHSLNGLIGAVRPRDVAFYSSLYTYLQFRDAPTLDVESARSVLSAEGTVNLSQTWMLEAMAKEQESRIRLDWTGLQMDCPCHFLCARGFRQRGRLPLYTRRGVLIPDGFPPILGMDGLRPGGFPDGLAIGTRGKEAVDRLSIAAGLVCNQGVAVSALKGLSAAVATRVSLSKADAVAAVETDELRESFRSHIEDLENM